MLNLEHIIFLEIFSKAQIIEQWHKIEEQLELQ